MATFNKVWESPDTLPSKEEIASPRTWLERMDRSSSAAAG
jgi:uncharacterized protein (DUF2342 family)